MFSPYTKILLVACCIVLVGHFNLVKGQSCSASFLLSNFTVSQSANVQCQIGYAADTSLLQCRPYDTVFDENYGKSCYKTSDCQLNFVCSEVSKICVPPKTRKLGEACLAKENCVDSFNCVNGICSRFVEVYDSRIGERCNYYDVAANKKRLCADQYYCNYVTSDTYYCFERIQSGIGGFCGSNANQTYACKAGICNYDTKICVPYVQNATQGQVCDVNTPDGFIKCISSLFCLNGKCVSNEYVKFGEKCDSVNTTSNTYSTCGDSLYCSHSNYPPKCIRRGFSPIGGLCVQNSTDNFDCLSGTCYNQVCVPYVYSPIGGKCGITNYEGSFSCKYDSTSPFCFNNTCIPGRKLGERCEQTSSCLYPLVCRSIGEAPKTCENRGAKNDNCTSPSECVTGLTCTYSKCTNLNGKAVGLACSLNYECDSGLCFNKVCSLDYNVTSCSNDYSCSDYSSKCSCGSGKASSSTVGKCASLKRCKVFNTILDYCLFNNGRGTQSTIFFDRYSSIHKSCIKEFSQYYSCMRIGIKQAGNVQALAISGVDINVNITDPAPTKLFQCGYTTSQDNGVCSGLGDCIADNVCSCYPGYTGTNCEKVVSRQQSKVNPTPSKSTGNDKNVSGGNSLSESYLGVWWMALITFVFFIISP